MRHRQNVLRYRKDVPRHTLMLASVKCFEIKDFSHNAGQGRQGELMVMRRNLDLRWYICLGVPTKEVISLMVLDTDDV